MNAREGTTSLVVPSFTCLKMNLLRIEIQTII